MIQGGPVYAHCTAHFKIKDHNTRIVMRIPVNKLNDLNFWRFFFKCRKYHESSSKNYD